MKINSSTTVHGNKTNETTLHTTTLEPTVSTTYHLAKTSPLPISSTSKANTIDTVDSSTPLPSVDSRNRTSTVVTNRKNHTKTPLSTVHPQDLQTTINLGTITNGTNKVTGETTSQNSPSKTTNMSVSSLPSSTTATTSGDVPLKTSTGEQQRVTASGCLLDFCPEAYCNNGGICSINTTCSPVCKCHPMFIDEKCTLAGNDFMPEPFKDIPKRIVEINLWIKGEDDSNLSNTSSDKYFRLHQAVNKTVSFYLQSLLAFNRNSKIILNGIAGKIQAQITSEFTYRNNRTIISFLNGNLIPSIVHDINKVQASTRRRRQIRLVSFKTVFMENITNVAILSVSTMAKYFSCDSSGFLGYTLSYSNNGFICVSLCTGNYCQNNAVCEHNKSGPICRCVSFLIYSSYGEHCENLAVNLNTFFGILFGSLTSMAVVAAFIFLIMYYCRRKRSSTYRNLDNCLGPKPIQPINKLQDTGLASKPELKRWTPNLDNVTMAPQVKILRPTPYENSRNEG
ncbi:mucin-4 isoform X2 [Pelobates cultripes]|uniref:Mucin-4 isoform X2 n=1 Tax=Pelobates cultripes TaxID=61616 RepID=A0AAD1VPZ3_PELCU|nr:mucin-4 isoform X2 [Pelobates cultripes]